MHFANKRCAVASATRLSLVYRHSFSLSLQKRSPRPLKAGLGRCAYSSHARDLEATHTPVLLNEVLQFFSKVHLSTLVDGTLGAGGHSSAILAQHPEIKTLVGIDIDPSAHSIASARLSDVKQRLRHDCILHQERANFSAIKTCMAEACGATKADGILLDLGVSSMQVDSPARGFSFSKDGPLDMRMGPSVAASAEQLVNTYPERELARIFYEYGEERHARLYAARIVDAREKEPIQTTRQLTAVIGAAKHRSRQSRGKAGSIHPATRVFQALRIAVNAELLHLRDALPSCIECLAPNGRLAVMSFHSLEDRIVKHAFQHAAGKGTDEASVDLPLAPAPPPLGVILTRKPVTPTEHEQLSNPRSRSAKLRVFQRA